MTTQAEVVSRLQIILDCDHGQVEVYDNYEEMRIDVVIDEKAVDMSLFNPEQIDMIIKGLTPITVAHKIKLR